tara:strand:+ start:323 stop:604 length:282 start_codon:yes stop_codon:yes gene_type:complete
MYKKSNSHVALAWATNTLAESHTQAYKTNGHHLWSYGKLIATTSDNKKIVFNYQAPDNFISVTTSKHVRLAKEHADIIADPEEINHYLQSTTC